jgi:hypothetical protein
MKRTLLAGISAGAVLLLAACGSPSNHTSAGHSGSSMAGMSSSMPGMDMSTSATSGGMGGMNMSSGNGLADTVDGYTLTLHSQPMGDMAMPVTFTITTDGKPVTQFDPEQTKLMHFYLIRGDLSGFQHLHPTMQASGTWSVTTEALMAGSYRIYVQCVPHAATSGGALVLSRPITIGGGASPVASLPAASSTTMIDGYTLAVAGTPKAGVETPLRITISKGGTPVTNLQPYLETYAYVTAIRVGDLAFAHLHPAGTVNGDHGGPTLTVNVDRRCALVPPVSTGLVQPHRLPLGCGRKRPRRGASCRVPLAVCLRSRSRREPFELSDVVRREFGEVVSAE